MFTHYLAITNNCIDTSLQERSLTFRDLSAIAADDAGIAYQLYIFIQKSCVTDYSGPPPTKRSRLHSDDLAFSGASQMSSQTDSTRTSMAGPSSTTIAVVSTRLNTKLGTVQINTLVHSDIKLLYSYQISIQTISKLPNT